MLHGGGEIHGLRSHAMSRNDRSVNSPPGGGRAIRIDVIDGQLADAEGPRPGWGTRGGRMRHGRTAPPAPNCTTSWPAYGQGPPPPPPPTPPPHHHPQTHPPPTPPTPAPPTPPPPYPPPPPLPKPGGEAPARRVVADAASVLQDDGVDCTNARGVITTIHQQRTDRCLHGWVMLRRQPRPLSRNKQSGNASATQAEQSRSISRYR